MDGRRPLSLGPPSPQPHRTTIKMVQVVVERAEIREILTQYLVRQGLISIPVSDGAHAQVVCETVAPDAVLLDLALPNPGSLALIAHIKARHPGVPLVVISGLLEGERAAQCRAKGADDVLPKPIDLTRLGQILARLLGLPHGGRPSG
jgi:two-component system nitrogen regulation response regulator GlnG